MTDTSPIVLPDPRATEQSLSARNRLVIGLLLVSAFVVILNETIMGVALRFSCATCGSTPARRSG